MRVLQSSRPFLAFAAALALACGALALPRAARAEGNPPPSVDSILQALEAIRKSPDGAASFSRQIDDEIKKIESEIDALDAEIKALEGGAAAPPASKRGLEIYGHAIAPLFKQKCARCHSPEKQKGGLDLSTRPLTLKGGDTGPAIVPGDAEKSLLYRLVAHLDEPHMPYNEEKLADEEIAAIKEWIAEGAPFADDAGKPKGEMLVSDADRDYWAFRPLARPETPAVKDAAWPKTPIDHFILAKLEAKALAPNPAVDRRKLIRRAYFDLIGLPPAPDEVDAFLADPDPQAYDKLVSRLLDNPHYGERWGRHWLDLARFAESHGYEQDYDRPFAYTYRDFVIKALNQDLPYDKFVKWQIAGDEFEPENPLAMTATGFLGAGTHSTQITKSQVEKERYDELDDMAGTIGTAMLGLTIACARCHDHKFDPIPAKDYYRIISTFTKTVRSNQDVPTDPQGHRLARAKWEKEHAPMAAALAIYDQEVAPAIFEEWLKGAGKSAQSEKWTVLELKDAKSEGGATLAAQPDGSVLATGENPKFDAYTFNVENAPEGFTAIRVEALADDSMAKRGPGRAANGNFALTDFIVTATGPEKVGAPVTLKLLNPAATFEQKGLPIAAAVDGDKKSGWAVDPEFGKSHAAVFELQSPVSFEGGLRLQLRLEFNGNDGHNIGRVRISVSSASPPPPADGEAQEALIEAAQAALKAEPPQPLSAEQRAAMLGLFRRTDGKYRDLAKREHDHRKFEPKSESAKAMICSEGVEAIRTHTQGGDYLEETHHLKRGDPNQKGDVARQGFLQALMRSPDGEKRWQEAPPGGSRTSYQRRSLANWIADTDAGAGPLLARVIVNRLWQHHMGRGIVATPSDFGRQGEKPSNPELLDWLATELVNSGWRLKPLHKLIMTSAAYMQSSAADDAKIAADPDGKLFWRRPRQRLEAEAVRDSMLSVCGELDPTMHGPGTLDQAMKRRSIYFFIKRSRLIPMMMVFDAPDTLGGMAHRPSTTVAPQALFMLNSPQVREWAGALAERIEPQQAGTGGALQSESALAGAVREAFRRALSRDPAGDELDDSLAFLRQQSESYKADGKANAPRLALTDFCQALMGLNEFVYVD